MNRHAARSMMLLVDIGNTHTHVGFSWGSRVVRLRHFPTAKWQTGATWLGQLTPPRPLKMAVLCSVVPPVTSRATRAIRERLAIPTVVLTAASLAKTNLIGIDYPAPATIGPDRLANAIAARHHVGAPAVVVDFGTAVTFDVVDRRGNYVGGIIAPGLAAMTTYLHEKTALLPAIEIRDVKTIVGRNTEEAMQIGAVRGYRGMIRELLGALRKHLRAPALPVVATGSYAHLLAAHLPEITGVMPGLTLEGLRLWGEEQQG